MCGILGVYGGGRAGAAAGLRAMAHRGPDDAGILEAGDGWIFGHRRLAVVDPTPSGKQPMQTPDGTVTVTFNGTIYNFKDLKQQLSSDYPFRSDSDTEVLLYGYLKWGMEGLLDRIQGMFAFALYDRRDGSLYLARDRFGKKPLFYAQAEGRFMFASTLPGLLACMGRAPEVLPRALDNYMTYMCVPGEDTIFQGVFKLPPARWLQWRGGRLQIRQYWNLSFAAKLKLTEGEVLDELDRLVRQAVSSRLVGDVPIGAFLSGGVDSSLVVGVMASLAGRPVTTVTAGFDDAGFDERPCARMVSRQWGTMHHEATIRPDAAAALPELIYHAGEPLADSSMLPTYYVSKLAAEHFKVVLNGDGGDELFAGYARPLIERAAVPWRKYVPDPIRRQLSEIVSRSDRTKRRSWRAVQQVLQAGARTPRDSFIFDRALRSHREALYTPSFRSELEGWHPDRVYQAVWDEAPAADSVDRMMYGDLMTYLPDELLVKMDTMTMAHGLEARSPLLDVRLAEFAAALPSALKTKHFQTKYLLKKLAERYVPREVLYRPKRGFNMPMSAWIRGELNGLVKEMLLSETFGARGYFNRDVVCRWLDEHERGARDHGQKLWSLFVLELWFRMFVDGRLKRTDLLAAPALSV